MSTLLLQSVKDKRELFLFAHDVTSWVESVEGKLSSVKLISECEKNKLSDRPFSTGGAVNCKDR